MNDKATKIKGEIKQPNKKKNLRKINLCGLKILQDNGDGNELQEA